MTTEDWARVEGGGRERRGDDDERRDDPVREPDLWSDLDLERADELPVIFRRDDRPAPTNGRPTGGDDTSGRRLDRAEVMAILSHMSVLFGIPVFMVPLVVRKDALALHHAKAAAIAYFAFYGVLLAAMFGSSLLLPVALAFYIPPLVGIARAVQHRDAGLLGLGDLGEWLFPWPKPR